MATQPSGNSVPCEATLSLDSGYGFSVCFFVLVGKKKSVASNYCSMLLALNKSLFFTHAADQVLKTSFELIDYLQDSS